MSIFKKLFYLFLPIILGSLVGVVISSYIDYNILIKPVGSPPSWLFPVMWSIIYLLMGLSYYIFKINNSYFGYVDYVYYIQLFINLMWSIIFFVFKWRFLAIIWIILLVFMVGMLIYLFYKEKKISAYLNILYFLWILYASYLTIGIYLLN